MSDKMRQLPFDKLMTLMLDEYRSRGSVFGISKIYRHLERRYADGLDLPFGPAAGPHTQLAQNIIAAYVSGARVFELKTVQTLDGEDLPVSKPCINAYDEGYNVEWSTELYVPQALDEYIKAWLAIKLIIKELNLSGSDYSGCREGFIFNMSVGYDFDGITSAKIDNFIESLKNASNTEIWKKCRSWALDNPAVFKETNREYIEKIPPLISDSITLSTLHGCPPEEIERIAAYLLQEKRLHTYVKCNPTLLGYDYTRDTLKKLGFDYIDFDERHFKHDLQYKDAVPMFKRLKNLAESLSLKFGVKLTNTFPVINSNDNMQGVKLPGEEMYMSGRALFPLSMKVASLLSSEFGGGLPISYSGGADAQNITAILDAGIWPVTMATTLLKPGGYERLYQTAMIVKDYIKNNDEAAGTDSGKIHKLTENVFTQKKYQKPAGAETKRKTDLKLPVFDCKTAPCSSGCPFGQDIPAYLRLVSEKRYIEALRVITEKNPLPHITGTICSHACMSKCMRYYYDSAIGIRAAKLEAAVNAYDELIDELKQNNSSKKNGQPVAIIGGGPAGLAAAYFLARAGHPVTIFEQRDTLGGIVRHTIPGFRISDEAIDKDIALVKAMGVDIKLSRQITDISELRDEGYRYIVAATGAWMPNLPQLKEGTATDALVFLESLKSGKSGSFENAADIVITGGGNTALDTARAAIRQSKTASVTILYRRTIRYMPADPEEIEEAIREGINIIELAAPLSLSNGVLTYSKMTLGGFDTSGRRGFTPTGETGDIPCDILISAIGNKTDNTLLKQVQTIQADTGKEKCDIYIIGDAAKGPATIARAIADAMKCAGEITGSSFDKYAYLNISSSAGSAQGKKGILYSNPGPEQCLECPTVCDVCADVCPNRANIVVPAGKDTQILHIDYMCNECGNCAVFCPYDGAPYLDKFTYFLTVEDFNDSKNNGFAIAADGDIHIRLDNSVSIYHNKSELPEILQMLIDKGIEYQIDD